jgi:hypothetical protein
MHDRKDVFHKGHNSKGQAKIKITSDKSQFGSESESEEMKDETSTDTASGKTQSGTEIKVEATKYGLSKPTRKIIRARTVSNENKT